MHTSAMSATENRSWLLSRTAPNMPSLQRCKTLWLRTHLGCSQSLRQLHQPCLDLGLLGLHPLQHSCTARPLSCCFACAVEFGKAHSQ